MENIFIKLSNYGFHDTKITSISCSDLEVKIKFDDGIYFLDENGKEANLSNPVELILKINSSFDSSLNSFEIREYGRKMEYIELSQFQKYLVKNPFNIAMNYYSDFNNSILFDGGFPNKQIFLSIEGVEDVSIVNII
ncbi:MAG: hypothetical protein E7332_00375 [Clostridiales bacterium]|nr:hypothetical protein [Clostridiales bacterium]